VFENIKDAIRKLCTPKKRLCIYPSCGRDYRLVSKIWGFDGLILIDSYRHFRHPKFGKSLRFDEPAIYIGEDGAVFQSETYFSIIMIEDNNIALNFLIKENIRLHGFIGKTDGCREGGNYECTNDSYFFWKILQITDFPLQYYTDHFPKHAHTEYSPSHWTGFPQNNGQIEKVWVDEEAHSFFCSRQYSISRQNIPNHFPKTLKNNPHRLSFLLVERHDIDIKQGCFGSVTAIFMQESILSSLLRIDGLFCTYRIFRKWAWRGYNQDNWYHVENISQQESYPHTKKILEICLENRWETVATMPYGNGQHQGIIQALQEWEGEYPKRIYFCYLDDGDYSDIADQLYTSEELYQ